MWIDINRAMSMYNKWKSVPLKAGVEREFWSSKFSFESTTWECTQSIPILASIIIDNYVYN